MAINLVMVMFLMSHGRQLSAVAPLHRKLDELLDIDYYDSNLISACIGSLGVAWIADKVGRKWAYALGLLFSYIGITLEFISTTSAVFFAGKFVKYGHIPIFRMERR